jgi:hypothetical protein
MNLVTIAEEPGAKFNKVKAVTVREDVSRADDVAVGIVNCYLSS